MFSQRIFKCWHDIVNALNIVNAICKNIYMYICNYNINKPIDEYLVYRMQKTDLNISQFIQSFQTNNWWQVVMLLPTPSTFLMTERPSTL